MVKNHTELELSRADCADRYIDNASAVSVELRASEMPLYFTSLPYVEKEKPPEICDREGLTTVAAFRPWRGLLALNPQSLAGLQTMRGKG